MKKILGVSGALFLLLSALSATAPAAVAQPSPSANWHAERVCADVPTGVASCFALKYVDDSAAPAKALAQGGQVKPASSTPPATGKTPADIQSAYNITGLKSGWADETALDVDAVSAACPDCKILVVQATTASITNLGTAVATAAKQPGVTAISNSYGGGDSADSSYGAYYNHPGIAVTASTGDNGYSGSSYPASSSYVTAVGGTSLVKNSSTRGWGESAWSGSGSGCSGVNAALPAAATFGTGCGKRASADVAAVADPQTGLAVYAPSSSTSSSWAQYGGTSLSSPLIAAMYALSGNSGSSATLANSLPYTNSGKFNDVASGSTGSCSASQWCLSGAGWDGPTGVGTPNGVAGL